MKALKRKWNSCRGASILLALLFLLICMMAGASVVMAASSNAGKIRSNREEQQKYLTLISALTLLCDELRSVEYVGCYIIEEGDPVPDTTRPRPGSSGGYFTNTTYIYVNQEGSLDNRKQGGKLDSNDWTGDNEGNLQVLLPLFKNWDYIFAEQFESDQDDQESTIGDNNKDEKIKKYLINEEIEPPDTYSYTLTLQVDGSSEVVNVDVNVNRRNESDSITLTASFENHPMQVKARLEPTDIGPRELEVLDPNNLEKAEYEEYITEKDEDNKTYTCKTTNSVTWELKEIAKVGGDTK